MFLQVILLYGPAHHTTTGQLNGAWAATCALNGQLVMETNSHVTVGPTLVKGIDST